MSTTAKTPFDLLGEESIARIVTRFYALIDSDPAYAGLRAMHGADLSDVREGVTRFLVGWLGGPRDWFQRGRCIMSLHRPSPIDAALAKQWSDAMRRAIAGEEGLDPDFGRQMGQALADMADAMINRPA